MRLSLVAAALVVMSTTLPAQTFNVSVLGTGVGRGVITSQPAGINCTVFNGDAPTGTCSFAFAANSTVTLTAVPDPNVSFNWSGACSGTTLTCQLSMTQSRSVTGNFVPTTTYLVTLTMSGNGYGTMFSSDNRANPPISCQMTAGVITGNCSGFYPASTKIQFQENPLSVARTFFKGWGGACAGVGNGLPCNLIADAPKAITGGFDSPYLQISKTGGGGSGSITSKNGAINCTIGPGGTAGTCSAIYPSQSVVKDSLTATPAVGSAFAQWSTGCTGNALNCEVIIEGFPTTVGVSFLQQAFVFTVSGTGSGSGTVTASGINCSIVRTATTGDCVEAYTFGSSATFTATPATGSRFGSWSGGCTGLNTVCTITASQTTNVAARFETDNGAVFVTGTGSGTVTSQPGGISCTLTDGAPTGQCQAVFTLGVNVTLTATPGQGFNFGGWGGNCAGTGTCQLNIDRDLNVSVNFTRPPVALTVGGTGNGTGTLSSTPAGISCTITGSGSAGTCSGDFAVGSTVTLTATPTQQSTFQSWSGDCTGTTPTCQVTMSQARSVTANFKGLLVDLSLSGTGTGDGSVKSDVGGMSCTVTRGASAVNGCVASVSTGASVKLTADPLNGSTFGGWTSGGCTGLSLACTVTVSQAGSVGARFTAPASATLLADALLGGAIPSIEEREQLDRFGNKDGQFNLGDLLALLDRTGEKLSPAIISSIIQAEQTRRNRTSPRSKP